MQTKRLKSQESRNKAQQEGKAAAVKLLNSTQLSLRKIAAATELSKTVVGDIKELLRTGDSEAVETQVMVNRMQGRPTILTAEEEAMLAGRLVFAASRRSAVDIDGIKRIMGHVAADGRPGWKNGVPSNDVVRSFRARHREITYRSCENKDCAKLKGESYSHVKGFLRFFIL